MDGFQVVVLTGFMWLWLADSAREGVLLLIFRQLEMHPGISLRSVR